MNATDVKPCPGVDDRRPASTFCWFDQTVPTDLAHRFPKSWATPPVGAIASCNATKHAGLALSDNVRLELSRARAGVGVSRVCPAVVRTNLLTEPLENLMKKVEASTLDSIADYRLVEAPAPVAGPGSVLLRIAACGVGYVDALVALGRYQVKPPLPHVPGAEVGAWVEAIGDGVQGLSVGDRVMARVQGGFAELACTPAALVTRIPDRMGFAQAAGFRVNYLTALHGLRDRACLAPGETLLVLGAAGGVGAAAIQVGKRLCARVVAVASTAEKRAFALQAGADVAIDAAPEGFRASVRSVCGDKGLQVVFDPVCGPLFEPAFRSLHWRGRHLVVGFVGGPIPALPANLPLMKGAALVGVDVRQFLLCEAELGAAHLDEMLGWVADGTLVPPVGREFAFGDFSEALNFALSGQGIGKTILRITDDAAAGGA